MEVTNALSGKRIARRYVDWSAICPTSGLPNFQHRVISKLRPSESGDKFHTNLKKPPGSFGGSGATKGTF